MSTVEISQSLTGYAIQKMIVSFANGTTSSSEHAIVVVKNIKVDGIEKEVKKVPSSQAPSFTSQEEPRTCETEKVVASVTLEDVGILQRDHCYCGNLPQSSEKCIQTSTNLSQAPENCGQGSTNLPQTADLCIQGPRNVQTPQKCLQIPPKVLQPPRFPLEVTVDHFSTPSQAQRTLDFLKEEIVLLRHKVRMLKQREKRALCKIKTLTVSVEELKQQQEVTIKFPLFDRKNIKS